MKGKEKLKTDKYLRAWYSPSKSFIKIQKPQHPFQVIKSSLRCMGLNYKLNSGMDRLSQLQLVPFYLFTAQLLIAILSMQFKVSSIANQARRYVLSCLRTSVLRSWIEIEWCLSCLSIRLLAVPCLIFLRREIRQGTARSLIEESARSIINQRLVRTH